MLSYVNNFFQLELFILYLIMVFETPKRRIFILIFLLKVNLKPGNGRKLSEQSLGRENVRRAGDAGKGEGRKPSPFPSSPCISFSPVSFLFLLFYWSNFRVRHVGARSSLSETGGGLILRRAFFGGGAYYQSFTVYCDPYSFIIKSTLLFYFTSS